MKALQRLGIGKHGDTVGDLPVDFGGPDLWISSGMGALNLTIPFPLIKVNTILGNLWKPRIIAGARGI